MLRTLLKATRRAIIQKIVLKYMAIFKKRRCWEKSKSPFLEELKMFEIDVEKIK
jgi:hypothetical protein